MIEGETRREREKAMHRREILEAAKKVFAKKGFAAATVDEIAREAEFSKGAIYFYFNSKEDLFLSLIQQITSELEEKIKKIVGKSGDTENKIESLIETHLSFFERDKEFFQIMASEHPRLEAESENRLKEELRERYLRYLDVFEEVMKDGISKGMLKDINPLILATALMGIIHSFTTQWILLGRKDPLLEMKSVILELFLRGAGLSVES